MRAPYSSEAIVPRQLTIGVTCHILHCKIIDIECPQQNRKRDRQQKNIPHAKGRAVFINSVLLRDAPTNGSTLSNIAKLSDTISAKWPISAIIGRFLVSVLASIAVERGSFHRLCNFWWHIVFIMLCQHFKRFNFGRLH